MPFSFDFDNDYRNMLGSLIEQTQSFLQSLVFGRRPYDYEVTFVEGVRESIGLALEESEPDFKEALAAVEFMREERFVLAGLWGRTLVAKLKVLQARAQQFLAGIIGSFRYLIDQLNALLGSFIAATGVAEGLKELKDLIANGIAEIQRPG